MNEAPLTAGDEACAASRFRGLNGSLKDKRSQIDLKQSTIKDRDFPGLLLCFLQLAFDICRDFSRLDSEYKRKFAVDTGLDIFQELLV